MTISINAIEAIWIGVNLVTFFLTLIAFFDARSDREAVKALNGRAREITAEGIVRREGFRVIVQTLLLGVAVPGLFDSREAQVNPVVIMLIAVPFVLLVSTVFDARDRKALTTMAAVEVLTERRDAIARLEVRHDELLAAILENTKISEQASENADLAYKEANNVNQKIAAQGTALVEQGEELHRKRSIQDKALSLTVDDTHDKVTDLHDELEQRS